MMDKKAFFDKLLKHAQPAPGFLFIHPESPEGLREKPSMRPDGRARGPEILESRIVSCVYEGPDPTLLGKRALVRTLSEDKSKVLVQFDDTTTGMGYGWHEMPVEHVVLEARVDGCH